MRLQRRHFEAFAAALLRSKPLTNHVEREAMRGLIIVHFAEMCTETNDNFDTLQFIAACNGGSYAQSRRRRRR